MSVPAEAIATIVDELREFLPDRVSTAAAVREQHGHDESYHRAAPPDVVVFPASTEEVARIVNVCARHRCPMIPFGTGTSLEGHVQALHGGVSIDVTGMNEILEVNAEDLDCRIQPGVRRKQLNEYLRDTGLFFPIDPGADASLGGMTATRASGTNAVRYGTMRENVLGLTVVMADGRIVKTGGARTKVRRRLRPHPAVRGLRGHARRDHRDPPPAVRHPGGHLRRGVLVRIARRCGRHRHPDPFSAAFRWRGSSCWTRSRWTPSIATRASTTRSLPTLFFEFHGSEQGVREQVEMVGALAGENTGGEFRWATRPEDRSRLWQARHDAYYAAMALRPGAQGWPTDVCVPISNLAECILETRADIDASGLLAPIVGHVGDGNFHLSFILDPDDTEELARAEAVNERMVARALDMGGTCTGEHGVGYGKIGFLNREHGSDAVSVMRQVKRALDPENLMNPGKILP